MESKRELLTEEYCHTKGAAPNSGLTIAGHADVTGMGVRLIEKRDQFIA
jgi:hypothetical protein